MLLHIDKTMDRIDHIRTIMHRKTGKVTLLLVKDEVVGAAVGAVVGKEDIGDRLLPNRDSPATVLSTQLLQEKLDLLNTLTLRLLEKSINLEGLAHQVPLEKEVPLKSFVSLMTQRLLEMKVIL